MISTRVASRIGGRFKNASYATRLHVLHLLGQTLSSVRNRRYGRALLYVGAAFVALKFRYAWLIVESLFVVNTVRKRIRK